MKLKITIEMNNAAFGKCDAERGDEAARILRELAQGISVNGLLVDGWAVRGLSDLNGNRVGEAKVTR